MKGQRITEGGSQGSKPEKAFDTEEILRRGGNRCVGGWGSQTKERKVSPRASCGQ